MSNILWVFVFVLLLLLLFFFFPRSEMNIDERKENKGKKSLPVYILLSHDWNILTTANKNH